MRGYSLMAHISLLLHIRRGAHMARWVLLLMAVTKVLQHHSCSFNGYEMNMAGVLKDYSIVLYMNAGT